MTLSGVHDFEGVDMDLFYIQMDAYSEVVAALAILSPYICILIPSKHRQFNKNWCYKIASFFEILSQIRSK